MNILGNAYKIPVVTYGPGNPHTSHTVDERVQIDEYVSSIDVFIRALFHMNRFHHNKNLNKNKAKI